METKKPVSGYFSGPEERGQGVWEGGGGDQRWGQVQRRFRTFQDLLIFGGGGDEEKRGGRTAPIICFI